MRIIVVSGNKSNVVHNRKSLKNYLTNDSHRLSYLSEKVSEMKVL